VRQRRYRADAAPFRIALTAEDVESTFSKSVAKGRRLPPTV
jgi:hypothetical protein